MHGRKKWELAFEKHHKDLNTWDEVSKKAYQLLLLHCHPDVEDKLDAIEEYTDIKDRQDPVELLKLIRVIAHQHDEVQDGAMALVEQALRLILHYYQKKRQSLSEHY